MWYLGEYKREGGDALIIGFGYQFFIYGTNELRSEQNQEAGENLSSGPR